MSYQGPYHVLCAGHCVCAFTAFVHQSGEKCNDLFFLNQRRWVPARYEETVSEQVAHYTTRRR